MNFKESPERIWLENEMGKVVAYVDFPEIEKGVVNVTHTVVDEGLRGMGVAGKLMESLVEKIKKEGRKIVLTCPYAVKWFEKHIEHKELLK